MCEFLLVNEKKLSSRIDIFVESRQRTFKLTSWILWTDNFFVVSKRRMLQSLGNLFWKFAKLLCGKREGEKMFEGLEIFFSRYAVKSTPQQLLLARIVHRKMFSCIFPTPQKNWKISERKNWMFLCTNFEFSEKFCYWFLMFIFLRNVLLIFKSKT